MEKKYNETYDQDIDNYITKKMTESEVEKFEQLMNSDKTLLEEVDFRKGVLKAMKWRLQINLAHEEMLKTKESQPTISETNLTFKERPLWKIGYKRVFAYAASVIILILSGFSWYASRNFSDKYLANNYIHDLVSLDEGNVKGGDNTVKDPFNQGLYHLNQKQYEKAVSFFESIPSQNETYVQARLYLSFSQFYTKDYPKATDNANIVIKESLDTKEKQKAEWLLIQIQLVQGKKDTSFFRKLNTIAQNPQHIYQKQAKTLQADLDSLWRKLAF